MVLLMKEAYKELRKKLKDEFNFPNTTNEYNVLGSVGQWIRLSGIKPTEKHTKIICAIMGSVPYPYQQADRTKILTYIKKHKYKEFKTWHDGVMKQVKKDQKNYTKNAQARWKKSIQVKDKK